MERQEGRGGEGKAKEEEGGFGQITLCRPQKSKSVAQNLGTHASPTPSSLNSAPQGQHMTQIYVCKHSHTELSSLGFSVKARGLSCHRPNQRLGSPRPP